MFEAALLLLLVELPVEPLQPFIELPFSGCDCGADDGDGGGGGYDILMDSVDEQLVCACDVGAISKTSSSP